MGGVYVTPTARKICLILTAQPQWEWACKNVQRRPLIMLAPALASRAPALYQEVLLSQSRGDPCSSVLFMSLCERMTCSTGQVIALGVARKVLYWGRPAWDKYSLCHSSYNYQYL